MSINGWLWVIFGILLVLTVIGFSVSGVLAVKNGQAWQDQLIRPFVGMIGPGNTLVTSSGDVQIKCPVGKNVRILGAYFEVYDPYSECVTTSGTGASKDFQAMCTNSGIQTDCNKILSGCTCDSSGNCTVNSMAPKESCECAHTDSTNGYQNCACSNYTGKNATNTYNCKSRDASSYLSNYCNGKNTCPVVTDSNQDLTSIFGPYPCNLSPGDPGYNLLPMVRGNDGIGGNSPSSMNQGYYIHGLFTCE